MADQTSKRREHLGSLDRSFLMQDRPIRKAPAEARQAVKVGAMRYVLGFGIAGAVIGLLLAWHFIG